MGKSVRFWLSEVVRPVLLLLASLSGLSFIDSSVLRTAYTGRPALCACLCVCLSC